MDEQGCVSADDIRIELINNTRTSHTTTRHSIRCFKHCTTFVFCFELPDNCPVCGCCLLSSKILVPPFIYKSPLEHEHKSQPAVLVRPSRGRSFLHDYANGDDLHCGLLDERGLVHDFDEKGLSTSEKWFNCIYIPIDYPSNQQPIMEIIERVKSDWITKCPRYNSENANCFSFVLFCLRSLGLYTGMSDSEFITEVVLPCTSEAAKYVTLYRQLVSNGGVYIQQTEPL